MRHSGASIMWVSTSDEEGSLSAEAAVVVSLPTRAAMYVWHSTHLFSKPEYGSWSFCVRMFSPVGELQQQE